MEGPRILEILHDALHGRTPAAVHAPLGLAVRELDAEIIQPLHAGGDERGTGDIGEHRIYLDRIVHERRGREEEHVPLLLPLEKLRDREHLEGPPGRIHLGNPRELIGRLAPRGADPGVVRRGGPIKVLEVMGLIDRDMVEPRVLPDDIIRLRRHRHRSQDGLNALLRLRLPPPVVLGKKPSEFLGERGLGKPRVLRGHVIPALRPEHDDVKGLVRREAHRPFLDVEAVLLGVIAPGEIRILLPHVPE